MNAHWLDFYFIMCLKQIKSGWHDVIFAIREKTLAFQHAILEAYDLELEIVVFLFHMSIRRKFELMMVVGTFPSKMMTKLQKIVSQIDIILSDYFFKSTPFLVWKLGSMNLLHAEDMMNQQIFFSLHSAKNQMEEHFTDVQSMYYFKVLSSSSLSISCAIKMRDHYFLFKRKATEKSQKYCIRFLIHLTHDVTCKMNIFQLFWWRQNLVSHSQNMMPVATRIMKENWIINSAFQISNPFTRNSFVGRNVLANFCNLVLGMFVQNIDRDVTLSQKVGTDWIN